MKAVYTSKRLRVRSIFYCSTCGCVTEEREVMERYMIESVEGFQEMSDKLKVAVMLTMHAERRELGEC